jgi:hypothetical protein
MNLEEASRAALEAARSGDLDGAAVALELRRGALAGGEIPTPRDLYCGDQTAQLLRELVQLLSHVDVQG